MKLYKQKQQLRKLADTLLFLTMKENAISRKEYEMRIKDLETTKNRITAHQQELERLVEMESRLKVNNVSREFLSGQKDLDEQVEKHLLFLQRISPQAQ